MLKIFFSTAIHSVIIWIFRASGWFWWKHSAYASWLQSSAEISSRLNSWSYFFTPWRRNWFEFTWLELCLYLWNSRSFAPCLCGTLEPESSMRIWGTRSSAYTKVSFLVLYSWISGFGISSSLSGINSLHRDFSLLPNLDFKLVFFFLKFVDIS